MDFGAAQKRTRKRRDSSISLEDYTWGSQGYPRQYHHNHDTSSTEPRHQPYSSHCNPSRPVAPLLIPLELPDYRYLARDDLNSSNLEQNICPPTPTMLSLKRYLLEDNHHERRLLGLNPSLPVPSHDGVQDHMARARSNRTHGANPVAKVEHSDGAQVDPALLYQAGLVASVGVEPSRHTSYGGNLGCAEMDTPTELWGVLSPSSMFSSSVPRTRERGTASEGKSTPFNSSDQAAEQEGSEEYITEAMRLQMGEDIRAERFGPGKCRTEKLQRVRVQARKRVKKA